MGVQKKPRRELSQNRLYSSVQVYRCAVQIGFYSTVHVYRAGYFSPEAAGDADAHANTDQAGHCQEQPHLEMDLDQMGQIPEILLKAGLLRVFS